MKSLLALGALAVAFWQLLNYMFTKNRFKNLPIIDGVVISSKLDNYNDVEGKRVYSANIRFRYSLNDKEYEADSIALRSFHLFPFHDYEHELVEKYQEGVVVPVRYFSANPEKAYLEVAPLSKLSTAALLSVTLVALSYLVFLSEFAIV